MRAAPTLARSVAGPRRNAVETWIFDLDNTLYEPAARLFDQIDARMTAFIMRELGLSRAEADELRRAYWRRHGTTLRGLMAHHGIEPGRFLADVHAIDLSGLAPDAGLAAALGRLPGARIVHTNGPRAHAERVLAVRGLAGLFDSVYAIEDKAYVPKPEREAYDCIIRQAGLEPGRAAMVEDDPRNLRVPKALGMTTIWICHGRDAETPDWVDHRAPTLAAFLAELG